MGAETNLRYVSTGWFPFFLVGAQGAGLLSLGGGHEMSVLGERGERLATIDTFSSQNNHWLSASLSNHFGECSPWSAGVPKLQWRAGIALKTQSTLCPSNSPSGPSST